MAVFDDKLRKPDRVIIKGKATGGRRVKLLGWCEMSRGRITLCVNCIHGTQYEFLCLLAHEMVHQWEQQKGTPGGHGRRFFAWRERLKETVNLPLNRTIVSSLRYKANESLIYAK